MYRAFITALAIGVTGLATSSVDAAIFTESFEADANNTSPPSGWTAGGTSGFWTVKSAAEGAEGGSVAITNADGDFVAVGEGADSFIFRSIDITGYENSPLEISILANDHGKADGTWEAGDTLFVEYAYGAGQPAAWNVAIQQEEDFVAGENNPEALASFSGLAGDPSGESTMWLRIRQATNHSSVEGAVVDLLEVDVVPEPASLALVGVGSLLMLRRRGSRQMV